MTTRIITFLIGDLYKPSFVTVTGREVDLSYLYIFNLSGEMGRFLAFFSRMNWRFFPIEKEKFNFTSLSTCIKFLFPLANLIHGTPPEI